MTQNLRSTTRSEPRTELTDLFAQAIRYGIEVEADYFGNGQNDEEYIIRPASDYADRFLAAAPPNPLTYVNAAAEETTRRLRLPDEDAPLPTPAPTLDVERLTQALGIVFPDIGAVPFYGEQIAAEYARLQPTEDAPRKDPHYDIPHRCPEDCPSEMLPITEDSGT